MRLFGLLLATLLCSAIYAGNRKSILRQNYVIVSDEFNNQVPNGKCLVTGVVFDPVVDGDGKQLPRKGVKIATLDQKKQAFTDENGQFKLLLDSKDTSLFMFAEGLEEIVIWNYNFQSKHVVTINFYPYYNNMMLEVDKPVIYLYSEEAIEARVSFACRGALTFTYPNYDSGWEVRVDKQGVSEAHTGKKYPYLFWEAETKDLFFARSSNGIILGDFIQTDTVVNYLEKNLLALGLNETETTDFITFWAPRMINSPYALVQFQVDEALNSSVSNLTVEPAPQAMRRVYMLFKPYEFDPGIEILKPVFAPFTRQGFTVLEWGGSEVGAYSLNQEIIN